MGADGQIEVYIGSPGPGFGGGGQKKMPIDSFNGARKTLNPPEDNKKGKNPRKVKSPRGNETEVTGGLELHGGPAARASQQLSKDGGNSVVSLSPSENNSKEQPGGPESPVLNTQPTSGTIAPLPEQGTPGTIRRSGARPKVSIVRKDLGNSNNAYGGSADSAIDPRKSQSEEGGAGAFGLSVSPGASSIMSASPTGDNIDGKQSIASLSEMVSGSKQDRRSFSSPSADDID